MKFVLDFSQVNDKKELFELINYSFKFEEKCTNLDALYDELTSIVDDYTIIIKNIDNALIKLGNYINILRQVLTDCEIECENIHILYE